MTVMMAMSVLPRDDAGADALHAHAHSGDEDGETKPRFLNPEP